MLFWLMAIPEMLFASVDHYTAQSNREKVSASLYRALNRQDKLKKIETIIQKNSPNGDSSVTLRRGLANGEMHYIEIIKNNSRIVIYHTEYNKLGLNLLCVIHSSSKPYEIWYSAYRWCGEKLGEKISLSPVTPPPFP